MKIEVVIVADDESKLGEYLLRRDASFIATHTTNLAIIQGISLAFAADKFIQKFEPFFRDGEPGVEVFQALLAFICTILVFAWVAIEYYWFMTVVKRRPAPRDTVVYFTLGATQCSLGLSVGSFAQWVWCLVAFGVVGLIAYGNSLWNLRQAENSPTIKRYARRSICYHGCYLLTALVVVIGIYWLEKKQVINESAVFLIFAATAVALLSLIVAESSRSLKKIEILAKANGWSAQAE